MSKYDNLDARTELEQIITKDSKKALEKRGFSVKHNGTPSNSAPGNVPDIEAWTGSVHFNIEVTKTTKSSSDREMLAISDHLKKTKELHPKKSCFVLYVSPETHYRMINAIQDHNRARSKKDQKIIPIRFSTFEIFIRKLSDAHKELYNVKEILKIFSRYTEFTDDDNALRIIHDELFPDDTILGKEIDDNEILKHSKLEQDLFVELDTIENRMRESGIATASDAIRNLVYLVFIKLYEEKQEIGQGNKNYFTAQNFLEFQQAQGQKKKKKAIHKLFEIIRDDEEFQKSGLFTETDHLADKLTDDFVLEEVIKPLEKYNFYISKVDGLGAAYEVLASRLSKDVKAGQFFTPKHVVQFMVKLAELDSSDIVLDPACGTGRFLIWAMDDMLGKVSGKNKDTTIKSIRLNQLYGTDNDPNVAKLAKMNMYIHDDGKSKIFDHDGLLLYKTEDIQNNMDAILTNPPLGKMNYRKPEYDTNFFQRMEVIPRSDSELITDSSSDDEEEGISGNLMKGGVLFLNACSSYLKEVRDPDARLEWRGGKLLIILDEGILNTDDYRKARQFIRKYFYIKAIISLTTDTFIPVSKTPTKTSILYAIKKDDPTAIQTEPIFWAHAQKVGMDTKKRPCTNHLMNDEGKDILSHYLSFKTKILDCYEKGKFNRRKFESLGISGGAIEETKEKSIFYFRFPDILSQDDRLDIAFWHPKFDNLLSYLSSTKFEVKELSKLVQSPIISGKTPKQYIFPMSGVFFIGARNVRNGKMDLLNSTYVDIDTHNGYLKSSKISSGDVLVTMAGSIGRSAIYSKEKEANISQAVARVRPQLKDLDPQYLVYYLNSPFGQIQFDRNRHDVNQPNINCSEISRIQIIRPPLNTQKKIVKKMIDIENKVSELTTKQQKNLQKLRNTVLLKSDLKVPSINLDYYVQNIESVEERLDFVFNNPNTHQIKQYLILKDAIPLGKIIDTEFEYGVNDYGREKGRIPFVNVENLNTDGSIHTDGIHYVNEVSNKKKILDENDILISRSRTVGLCSLVTQTEKGFTYGSFILKFRIKPKIQIKPQYVVNFINSDLGQAQILYLQTGARDTKPGGGNNINPDQLKQLMIIPPSTAKKQNVILATITKLKAENEKIHSELKENLKIFSKSFETLVAS